MPDEKSQTDPQPEVPPEPPTKPLWQGSLSSKEEIIAADGHVVLSKEDIKAAKDK